MRYVHCEGCDRKEPVDVPKEDSIMIPVTVALVTDGRSWAKDQAETFEADLCDRCRAKMLHTFFGISADFDPEIPRWLSEPLSALEVGR
jgi:hypothetical protein